VICSYNKSQRDALFLNFILVKNVLVMLNFSMRNIPVAGTTLLRLLIMDSKSVRNM